MVGAAKKYDLDFKQSSSINDAINCLQNSGMVICNTRGGDTALFSTNGHYIVLIRVQNNNFVLYDADLYNGKYTINGRQGKVTVNGNEVITSFENMKIEARQYFCFTPKANNVINTTAKYVRVNTSLNIRSGPGTENSIIGGLRNNTLVTVFEQSNGFSRIGERKVGFFCIFKRFSF